MFSSLSAFEVSRTVMDTNLGKTQLTRLLQDDHGLGEMKTEDRDEKSRVWIIK